MSEYTTYILPSETAISLFDPAAEGVQAYLEPPKSAPKYVGADYLLDLTSAEKRVEIIHEAALALKCVEFDSIAFIGMSGALLAPTLAYVMNKELIALRKQPSNSHSFHSIEGYAATKKYIVVDDFICTGETLRDVIKRMKDFAPQAEFVGTYMYSDHRFVQSGALWFGLEGL